MTETLNNIMPSVRKQSANSKMQAMIQHSSQIAYTQN